MTGVGGWMPRSARRFIPPVPDDGIPRCEFCRARLDFITPWNQPHICKELTFGTPMPPLPVNSVEADRTPGTASSPAAPWPTGTRSAER